MSGDVGVSTDEDKARLIREAVRSAEKWQCRSAIVAPGPDGQPVGHLCHARKDHLATAQIRVHWCTHGLRWNAAGERVDHVDAALASGNLPLGAYEFERATHWRA